MRILVLSNLHPTPWQPGRGVFNANLVEGLRAADHEVCVAVPVDWRDQRGSPQATAADAEFLTWYHPPLVRRDLWDRWMWFSISRSLRTLAENFRPEVVLGGWVHPDGAVALRLARALGIPGAVLAGGSDLLLLPRSNRRRRAIATTLSQADVVLTHGDHLRRVAVGLGAAEGRAVAFYRGVDPARFHPGSRVDARLALGLSPEGRILLSVGNLAPVKGHDVLVEALASDELRHGSWTWIHLGDGEQRATLLRRIEAAGLESRVRLPGRQPHDRLADWYRAADLQVLPSRSEGVPNVLLEGMACDLPFVASAVGGVPEIAPDPSWCVPPNDPAALAAALRRSLDLPPTVTGPVPTQADGIATVAGALQSALRAVP